MEAIRETAEVNDHIVTLRLPDSFNAKRVEVIVIAIADEQPITEPARRRAPSPELAGTRLLDDLMVPAASDSEWDALK
jgi:hypothetical protein